MATRTELLTAYAAGETSPGLSLLCAAQLSLDDRDRAFVDLAEEVAGRALREEAPPPEAAMDLDAMMARLDEPAPPAPERAAAERAEGPMPGVLLTALGCGFDAIPWRFRLPGISEHVLRGFEEEKVSLMRARPGARVPQHTHRGFEATLVLAGEMKDEDRVLTKGDVALCGAEHDHHPEIIGDETCYCLIVVDGGLRFTGRFSRALNLFGDSARRR